MVKSALGGGGGGEGRGAYAASQTYEEIQSNRVSDFHDFVCSLFPKAILFDCYFTISVIVCLCMYVLVKFFFLDSRLVIFWNKQSFWLSACSVLIVVPLP